MKDENKRPLFELVFDENMGEGGVDLISFVDSPAIKVDWMVFSKDVNKYKFSNEGDKFLVTGPAMIPNEKIVRMTDDGKRFDVFFTEDTIRKSSELFFKSNNHQTTNVNHNRKMIEGVTVVESWLIEDPKVDKALALGFEGLPKGTWMATYKVNDIGLWEKIKSGEVKGFSIEGFFIEKAVKMHNKKEEFNSSEWLYEYVETIINSTILPKDKFSIISLLLNKNETK